MDKKNHQISLKEAQKKGKLEQFAKEHANDAPADKKKFNKLLKTMVSQKKKPVRGTSRKGSSGS